MTHIKLDDGFGEHQKIACLSHLAYRLYVNGLGYCSRRETDGFVPKPIVTTLVVDSQTRIHRACGELMEAGLWVHREPVPRSTAKQGYDVHDYLDHQRSKAQITAQKEAGRQRFQRWRNGSSNGVAIEVEGALATPDLTTPEGRGQRAEGRVRGSPQSGDKIPPNPPRGARRRGAARSDPVRLPKIRAAIDAIEGKERAAAFKARPA